MAPVVDQPEGGKLFRVKASQTVLVHNRSDPHTTGE